MRLGTSWPCGLQICSCRSLFFVIFSLPLLGNDDCCAADDEINTASRQPLALWQKSNAEQKQNRHSCCCCSLLLCKWPGHSSLRPFAMQWKSSSKIAWDARFVSAWLLYRPDEYGMALINAAKFIPIHARCRLRCIQERPCSMTILMMNQHIKSHGREGPERINDPDDVNQKP